MHGLFCRCGLKIGEPLKASELYRELFRRCFSAAAACVYTNPRPRDIVQAAACRRVGPVGDPPSVSKSRPRVQRRRLEISGRVRDSPTTWWKKSRIRLSDHIEAITAGSPLCCQTGAVEQWPIRYWRVVEVFRR